MLQGTHVVTVRAFDKDSGPSGAITYSFSKETSNGIPFRINPDTGSIYTTEVLTSSDALKYDIDVIATDSGSPNRHTTLKTTVNIVDVEPSPMFEKPVYAFDVEEGTAVRTKVVSVGVKYDGNEMVKYSILPQRNGSTYFCVNLKGDVTIAKPLDREEISVHRFRIYADIENRETVYTDVHITVTDRNDNTPYFKDLSAVVRVKENIPKNTVIATLSASDADDALNAELQYSIVAFSNINSEGKFILDSQTGALMTSTVLDHEKQSRHVITVEVRDQGYPPRSSIGHVTVVVQDENEHAPVFPVQSYRTCIAFNTVVGTEVMQVQATDADAGLNGEVE